MESSLSKFNNKPKITLHNSPLTAGNLRKVASGIWKNSVKYFTSGIHQNYGYERFTQSIKSSLIDVYDRFPLQSFEMGSVSIIKVLHSLKSKGLAIKDILCYPKRVRHHFLGWGSYTMLSRKLRLGPFHLQTSPQLLLLCHQMKTHEKITWWVSSTCPQPLECYASIKMYTL